MVQLLLLSGKAVIFLLVLILQCVAQAALILIVGVPCCLLIWLTRDRSPLDRTSGRCPLGRSP